MNANRMFVNRVKVLLVNRQRTFCEQTKDVVGGQT